MLIYPIFRCKSQAYSEGTSERIKVNVEIVDKIGRTS